MTLISFACIKSFKEHSNQSHWRHRWSCNPKLEKNLNVFETVSPATKIFIRNLKKQLVCLTFHFYKQIFKNLQFFFLIIFLACFIEKEPSVPSSSRENCSLLRTPEAKSWKIAFEGQRCPKNTSISEAKNMLRNPWLDSIRFYTQHLFNTWWPITSLISLSCILTFPKHFS